MEKMKLFNLYIFSNVFGRAGGELDSRISISFFFFFSYKSCNFLQVYFRWENLRKSTLFFCSIYTSFLHKFLKEKIPHRHLNSILVVANTL